MKFKNLAGTVIGNLLLIAPVSKKVGAYSRVFWECQCACGNRKLIRASAFDNGTVSCGCLLLKRYESLRDGNMNLKHGGCVNADTATRKLYRVWQSMKNRCGNPNHKSWSYYGGRGITVSDEWMQFENFLADMLPSYVHGLSLDRLDNNAGYSKANCAWVSKTAQANNRSPRRCA